MSSEDARAEDGAPLSSTSRARTACCSVVRCSLIRVCCYSPQPYHIVHRPSKRALAVTARTRLYSALTQSESAQIFMLERNKMNNRRREDEAAPRVSRRKFITQATALGGAGLAAATQLAA